MDKRVTIVFTGLSVENTPKLTLVKKAFESNGYSVSIKGIVKSSSLEERPEGLYVKGNSQGIKKLIRVFWLQLKLVFHLLFKDKSDFYYSVNTLSGLVVMFVSMLKSKKYVYEAHEMVFGVNYPFFKGSWRKMWNFFEKAIINRSEWFFTTDQFRLRFYHLYLRINKEKQGYLLNVPELQKLDTKSSLRAKYGVQKKNVISYCGGVIPGRNMEEIIQAFAKLNQEETELIVAGSIDPNYEKDLRGLARSVGVEGNITFTGLIENQVLREYMKLSDITFTLYKSHSLNNRFSSPNKIFDAIHSGTYFIASDSPLIHYIVSQYPVGRIVKNVNELELTDHLKKALLELDTLNAEIFEEVSKMYCWEKEVEKLNEMIADMGSRSFN